MIFPGPPTCVLLGWQDSAHRHLSTGLGEGGTPPPRYCRGRWNWEIPPHVHGKKAPSQEEGQTWRAEFHPQASPGMCICSSWTAVDVGVLPQSLCTGAASLLQGASGRLGFYLRLNAAELIGEANEHGFVMRFSLRTG